MRLTSLSTLKSILIISLVGFVVFFNMLDGKFLMDDAIFKQDAGISFNSIFLENYEYGPNFYRPVFTLYYKLLHLLFGNHVFLYHFTQLFLHTVNAALVFILLKKFLNKSLALLLSLVFLVHPIQVESVAFIATSSEVLFFLFGMLGLLLGISDTYSRKKIILCFTLLFLSLLSKETGILFIFALIIYKFIFKDRHFLAFSLYGLSTILFYLYMRLSIANSFPGTAPATPIGVLALQERILSIPAMIFYYLKTFFMPLNPATEQLWAITKINLENFYFPAAWDFLFFLVVLALGIFISIKQKKKFTAYLFFLFWFLLGLFIHLQIFPLDATVADRFFYFPILGLLALIGIGINYLKIGKIFFAICFILISLLSLKTIYRNENWQSNESIYSHDAKIIESWTLQKALGHMQDTPEKQLVYFKRSVELFPREDNLFYLALTYEQLEDFENAKKTYAKILETPIIPRLKREGHEHYLAPYVRYARFLLLYSHPSEAKNEIQKALVDYPDSWQLWALLALANQKLGNRDGAIFTSEKAKSLNLNSYTKGLYAAILKDEPYPMPKLDFNNHKAKN